MQAQNRLLPEWFNRIQTGQIKLPRFQRFEAWGAGEVGSLLEAVLRELPAGAALILDVCDKEKFVSRTMEGAPTPTERVNEHLLDGQQRLTALWKSLNDLYLDRTYFAFFEKDEEINKEVLRVHGQARWFNDGKKFPIWADNPAEVHARGYIPLRLLRPGDILKEIGKWCDDATTNDGAKSRDLERQITKLREKITTYNVPYLALPVTTEKDVALDVFVKLNTTAVKLSPFDIVVAQVEEAAGESLHDLVNKLRQSVPRIENYIAPEDLILSVAAMREDRSPTQASYNKLDLKKLVDDWPQLVEGVKWAVKVLEDEHVYDSNRLPTVAVLYCLAALHRDIPAALDARGNARTIVRKYIWRSFLTSRYENAAATMTLQDYRGLRAIVANGANVTGKVPLFDEQQYPLPNADVLMRAGWPKGRDIIARGILAVSIKKGAADIADGERASAEHLKLREYHHLFPFSLLRDEGGLDEADTFRALNCAVITWNTNRNISAKEPLRYLRERTERAVLGEQEIRARLQSHVIPFDRLNVGGYDKLGSEKARKIRADYDAFLAARAEMLLPAVRSLCDGADWPNQ